MSSGYFIEKNINYTEERQTPIDTKFGTLLKNVKKIIWNTDLECYLRVYL